MFVQGLIIVAVIAAVLLLVVGVIKVASNPGGNIERRDREVRVRGGQRAERS